MNRRTFLQTAAITTLLPSIPLYAKKQQWIQLDKQMPKVGQRIVLVLYSFEKKPIQITTIHIGKVLTVNHRPSPTYEPKMSLEEEMRYQNCDGGGIYPKEGYALWYKKDLPYNAVELSKKKMKCLNAIVWWGGEDKLGTVYAWNYRNGEPTFKWWAPIDQIPDTLPPTPLEIYDFCRKKTKEAVKKWHHLSAWYLK